MDDAPSLQEWVDLFPGAVLDTTVSAYRCVVSQYGSSNRHYHTLTHVSYMLGVRAVYFPDAPATLDMAIWLHDVVWLPGCEQHNEAASAAYAGSILPALGVDHIATADVANAILATAGHAQADTPLAEQLCDIDLLSLGTEPHVYAKNSAKIRLEYAHVSEIGWQAGRRSFIQHMLRMPRIYKTQTIRDEYEARARENLWTEFLRLPGAIEEVEDDGPV